MTLQKATKFNHSSPELAGTRPPSFHADSTAAGEKMA